MAAVAGEVRGGGEGEAREEMEPRGWPGGGRDRRDVQLGGVPGGDRACKWHRKIVTEIGDAMSMTADLEESTDADR